MSQSGLEAVRLAVTEVKDVIGSLTAEEWAMRSGCDAWTVKDLVAHMSSNYKEICEPSPAPDEPVNLPAERLMDMLVEPRKDWTNEQVRDEYLAYCDGAVAGLAALQDEPLASTPVPLADLGTYAMHLYADAFAFDHYCHLRVDLLQPVDAHRHPADAARARARVERADHADAHRSWRGIVADRRRWAPWCSDRQRPRRWCCDRQRGHDHQ
jgi:hypothetical protein